MRLGREGIRCADDRAHTSAGSRREEQSDGVVSAVGTDELRQPALAPHGKGRCCVTPTLRRMSARRLASGVLVVATIAGCGSASSPKGFAHPKTTHAVVTDEFING